VKQHKNYPGADINNDNNLLDMEGTLRKKTMKKIKRKIPWNPKLLSQKNSEEMCSTYEGYRYYSKMCIAPHLRNKEFSSTVDYKSNAIS
jgi:hypothetical protein